MTEKQFRALLFCLEYIIKVGDTQLANIAQSFKDNLKGEIGSADPTTVPAIAPVTGEPTDPLA